MKLGLNKGLPKTTIFFSVTTIIFAGLSLLYVENWLLRIITQASLFFMILLNGIYTFSKQKEKSLGYLLIGVAAFIFFVMVNTIFVGFKIGAL